MGFKSGADGVAKQGKTKGKNLGDSGPSVGIQKGAKGCRIATTHGCRQAQRAFVIEGQLVGLLIGICLQTVFGVS